jgi:alkylhydroperoxidase family enzyme
MGKPATPEYIALAMIVLAALFCLGNGLCMVAAPTDWYWAVPTVPATGPANRHFITDIGLAYLSCGAMLLYGAWYADGRWLALVAGSLWLTAHGVFHVVEVATGMGTASRFRTDVPGVLGPPLLVLAALGILIARRRIAPAGLPSRLFVAIIEKLAPGEIGYVHELAAAPGHALEKFMHFMPAAMHRHAAPPDLFHLARIGATLAEDCGPCAMIAARGARDDGVPRALVNVALAGSRQLAGDQLTAFEFGSAVAGHSAEAFMLGDAIEQKFGRAVRLELALTAALVRGYPALKRGLGLSKPCAATRLVV